MHHCLLGPSVRCQCGKEDLTLEAKNLKKTNFGRERHKRILKFLQPKYTNLAENRAGKFNKYKLVYYYPVWDKSIMEQLANNGDAICGKCKRFHYRGCGGNDNQLESKEKCEASYVEKKHNNMHPPLHH